MRINDEALARALDNDYNDWTTTCQWILPIQSSRQNDTLPPCLTVCSSDCDVWLNKRSHIGPDICQILNCYSLIATRINFLTTVVPFPMNGEGIIKHVRSLVFSSVRPSVCSLLHYSSLQQTKRTAEIIPLPELELITIYDYCNRKSCVVYWTNMISAKCWPRMIFKKKQKVKPGYLI